MYECTTHGWTTQKLFEIEINFHQIVRDSILHQDVTCDVIPMNLTYLKDTFLNRQNFENSYTIISQKTTDMVQVTTAFTFKVVYGLSNVKFTIDLSQF